MIGDKKSVVMESDRGAPGGVAALDNNGKVPVEQLPDYSTPKNVATLGDDGILSKDQRPDAEGVGAIPANEKGSIDGVATLDGVGKLSESQKPDYNTDEITGLAEALESKQNKLTFDDAPTKFSENPVKSGGVYYALQTKSNQNLLDNWYFVDPINQRNVSGVFNTVGSYFIDRWVLIDGSVELTSNGIKLNGTIEQRLEYVFDNNVIATAITKDGPVEANYNKQEKKFKITANGETIIAAKLELGSVQTLAHKEGNTWVLNDPPPNKALELSKCQRYCITRGAGLTGFVRGINRLEFTFAFSNEMRTNPTISLLKDTMQYFDMSSFQGVVNFSIEKIDSFYANKKGTLWVALVGTFDKTLEIGAVLRQNLFDNLFLITADI